MRLDRLSVYFITIEWHGAQYKVTYYDFAENILSVATLSVVTQQTFDSMRKEFPYLISIEDRTRGSRHD